MVHIVGTDSQKIGLAHMNDLGLNKCSNCNQEDRTFGVYAIIHVNKLLAWQVAPKFGSFKSGWIFQIICPICEKGYQFLKEKGRDEVQKIMLQKKSIIRNVWSYFLDSHGLYNNIDNLKDRQNQVKSVRKNAKILLDDLAKLKMDNLLHVLISSKDNYLEFLKKNMENNKRCGFDIEL